MSDSIENEQPKRKTPWSWIVGIGALALAAITGVAGLTDNLPKVREAAKYVVSWVIPEKSELTLRDAKKVYNRIDGAGLGRWRRTTDYEVLVEAILSKQPLKGCAADLDTGSRQGYYHGLDLDGKEAKLDVEDGNGLVSYKFYIPLLDFPTEAKIRLRCDKDVSRWAPIVWPKS